MKEELDKDRKALYDAIRDWVCKIDPIAISCALRATLECSIKERELGQRLAIRDQERRGTRYSG